MIGAAHLLWFQWAVFRKHSSIHNQTNLRCAVIKQVVVILFCPQNDWLGEQENLTVQSVGSLLQFQIRDFLFVYLLSESKMS